MKDATSQTENSRTKEQTQRHFNRPLCVGVLTLLVLFCVLISLVPQNMWPHDEGQYGQSAVRVLAGELPHRDFHEMYTGMLTYWNALTFLIAGQQLVFLRYALVLASLPAAWAMYDIVRRLTGRVEIAALVSFSSYVLSIGSYHAASPNYYLSYLAMIVTWMMVRHAQSPHSGWIFGVGLCAGIAISFKVTGLYTLAAASLVVTYQGARTACSSRLHEIAIRRQWWFRLLVAAMACACTIIVLRSKIAWDTLLYFALPILSVLFVFVRHGQPVHFSELLKRYLALGAGATVAITLFLIPWLAAGAMNDFGYGVFVLPFKRLQLASYPPPQVSLIYLALPLCLCFLHGSEFLKKGGLICAIAILALGLMDPERSLFLTPRFMSALASWRWFLPVVIPCAYAQLSQSKTIPNVLSTQVFAIVSVAAFSFLNQFPFAHSFYFFFCFPQVALAGVALACLSAQQTTENSSTNKPLIHSPEWIGALAICAFACFTLLRFGIDGSRLEYLSATEKLSGRMRLSGLVVPRELGMEYVELKQYLDHQLDEDQTIIAGPDSPEVYYFCERENLTPLIFDFFADESQYADQLLELAERDKIGAVVIKGSPPFSPKWPAEMVDRFQQQFPNSHQIGGFLILKH